jgi:cytochrome P450
MGLTIPAGVTLSFPSYHYNFDGDVHKNPDTFDAKRHLRKRQQNGYTKYQFASVSEDTIN